MLTNDDIKKITNETKLIGSRLIKLGKNKKSFGSFFIPFNNNEVMTFLPYFQQAIWGCPMNYEHTIFWQYHKDLSQINDYEFKMIFVYEYSNKNNVELIKSKIYENAYELKIQCPQENVGDIYSIVLPHLMRENPYVKH